MVYYSDYIFNYLNLCHLWCSSFVFKNKIQLQLVLVHLPPRLREQEAAHALWPQFMNGLFGQFVARDEVTRLLHHRPHLLQFVETDAGETARHHNHLRRLHPDARHTEQHLIISRLDINRKELGVL